MTPSVPSRTNDLTDSALGQLVDGLVAKQQRGELIDWSAVRQEHPEHAEELGQLIPVLRELAHLSAAAGEVDPDQRVEHPSGILGDFRIVREVGRGGMGVVYEAEQLSMGRRVALKVLPFAATMDPRHLQRFHTEAKAAGMLHHPNIVPVFGVGCERSVHFYAMQFIDGTGLDKVIAELRRERDAEAHSPGMPPTVAYQPEVAQSRVETAKTGAATPLSGGLNRRGMGFFRRVAEIGVQAAEALEYAHSLGVVHRDIKPGNLLLDVRGQMWVADFGLARLGADSDLTMSGDLLGTLRYMSPEQALARHNLVDHRSDVYSLGATLYELLTLRPVVEGKDRQEILRRIAEDEPEPPRKVNRSIPVDLETVVLKALAKSPGGRYATAGELAEDLRNFLMDKPVRAKRPTLRQRVVKCARRNSVAVTAGSLVLAVLLIAAGLLGLAARDRAVRSEELVTAALGEVERLTDEQRWPEALVAAKRVYAILDTGEGTAAQRGAINELLEDLRMIERLENIRLEKAALIGHRGGINKPDCQWADAEYNSAFQEYGIDVTALSVDEATAAIQQRRIRLELALNLDEWAQVRRGMCGDSSEGWEHFTAIARAVDPDPRRQRLRDAWSQEGPSAGDKLRALASSVKLEELSPITVNFLGKALKARDFFEEAADVYRRAQHSYSGDFWINFELAYCLGQIDPPDQAGAIRFYTAALAARPDTPIVLNNLGAVLGRQGQIQEAEEVLRRSLDLNPQYPTAWSNLGLCLVEERKYEEAVAAHRRAIELNPRYATAWSNLGNALREQDKVDEAISACRKALEIDPTHSGGWTNLGLLLDEQGKYAEAEAAHRRALDNNPRIGLVWYNLALNLFHQGKLSEAVTANRKAVELDPLHADAWSNLGFTLKEQGEPVEAERAYRKSLGLNSEDANTWAGLGNALADQGKLLEADQAYRKAIDLDPQDPMIWNNFGLNLARQGKRDEAEKYFRKAIEVDPRYAGAWSNLGKIFSDRGEFDESETAHRKALEIDPRDAVFWTNLGATLYRNGKEGEGEAAYRKAVELDPTFGMAWNNLGGALLDQEKYAEAETACRKALANDPELGDSWANLANALAGQAKWPEALEAHDKSLRFFPEDADVANDVAWLLATCPDVEIRDAERAVKLAKKATELAPNEGNYWNTLAVAQYRAGDWKATITAVNRSIKAMKAVDVTGFCVLAMAKWQLGEKEEARKLYDKIAGWIDQNKPDNAELNDLRAEAAELLGVEKEVTEGTQEGSPSSDSMGDE